ncbi:hypothetical protein IU500_24605 [Nocardia terpenica]|uniref:hypothetical protein n=1 Tax=Nocardia terpenica TaxID=455432 RepID=UPI001892ECCB|nr:hypothetical protein [Nocardia terpenica]MBF6064682.1 hypothetical protein [Nocardia terpenica]MBF6107198.1 hypothetical protein [Nocardia terpenica]MBF6114956.1 hypothetical protein [Nocardia terpenica]MBF6122061.1 hypothetical protein [Nocardia terpenica]MBF6154444.1 hypothetical protein [Nocardia terpenica]
MNMGRTATAVDPLLFIDEISARTGHSPKSIRQLRSKGHELYSLARKVGNRLALEESTVGHWIERHKDATTKRLLSKKLKQNRALDESLERLVSEDEMASLESRFDTIRHHSWCINVSCHGCLGERW